MVCHIVPCYTGIMKFSGDETKAPRFSCFMLRIGNTSGKALLETRVLFRARKEVKP